MKQFSNRLVLGLLFTFGILIVGCDKTENPASNGTTSKGLFKTSGTFSFSSNRGNFLAEGIFDTLMTNASASGAFKYTEGTHNVVMVLAYKVTSQTNISMALAAAVDTTAAIANGASYPFAKYSGTKIAMFAYVPNIADTSANAALYVLANGSFNVSTLTATAISGSFSGSGFSLLDTTKTITITSGSCNTPIVDKFFDSGIVNELNKTTVEARIKAIVRKELVHLR